MQFTNVLYHGCDMIFCELLILIMYRKALFNTIIDVKLYSYL